MHAIQLKGNTVPELSDEQQAALAQDNVDSEPIGADEILLVGDLKYGIPLLRIYYDCFDGGFDTVEFALQNRLQPSLPFLKWANADIVNGMKTLREVQRIRDLVSEAQGVVSTAQPDPVKS